MDTTLLEREPVWDLQLGGALRFNYNLSTWKPNQAARGGDFGYDVFRINVDARFKKLSLHAEQRFYSEAFGGAFMKYGWFQYPLSERGHLKVGLIPAYFGNQQYNSHSWFFALPYYMGFEDDHDMGLSYTYNTDDWQLDLGFYKNAEELSFSDSGPISDSRYGYDVSGIDKEVNTGRVRLIRTLTKGDVEHKLGTTLGFGGLYNIETTGLGRTAVAGLHYQLSSPRWSVKTVALTYVFDPDRGGAEAATEISMSAYGAPYLVAARAQVYTFCLAYNWDVNWGPISNVQLYNDYNYMAKGSGFEETQMNVLGALLTAGKMYIYCDAAMGRNQPWLGPLWTNALSSGDADASWSTRFNLNVGYYF